MPQQPITGSSKFQARSVRVQRPTGNLRKMPNLLPLRSLPKASLSPHSCRNSEPHVQVASLRIYVINLIGQISIGTEFNATGIH